MKARFIPTLAVVLAFGAGAAMHVAGSLADMNVKVAGTNQAFTVSQPAHKATPLATPVLVTDSPESPQTRAVTGALTTGTGEPLAPSVSPTPVATPTPTPSPTVKPKPGPINGLNGSITYVVGH